MERDADGNSGITLEMVGFEWILLGVGGGC